MTTVFKTYILASLSGTLFWLLFYVCDTQWLIANVFTGSSRYVKHVAVLVYVTAVKYMTSFLWEGSCLCLNAGQCRG